jgi:hypothetical protein
VSNSKIFLRFTALSLSEQRIIMFSSDFQIHLKPGTMKTMKMITVMAAVLALAITGCKKDDMDPSTPAPQGRQFEVNMTDAPANFARMDLTIDGVEAYHDSQGWIVLNSSTRALNILSFANGSSATIAVGSNVATGHYSKVRVHFTDANSVTVRTNVTIGTLVISGGSTSHLTWGGPQDRYVELVVDENVSEQEGAEVLIDFDAASSVYEGLNTYVINPSMREMHNATTGAKGVVAGASGQAFIQFTDGVHTYSAYADASGHFLTRGMEPGTYTAYIWAPVKNESDQIEEQTQSRSGIVVVSGTYTAMGTIQF